MAPKEIMGVTLPSQPPEDEPPMKRPRPPAQQPAQRADTPAVNDWDVPSAKAPQARKDSPPGGIAIQGKGWKITMPHVALVAVLTTLGGWFGKDAISKGEQAELADVLKEVRALRKDVRDLKSDVADAADEPRERRAADKRIVAYTEEMFTPMVASLRKLGVKMGYDGADRATDVEFHQPPLGGSAPPIQPKSVLPERPSL